MNQLTEFGILAFTSLFTMVNPLGVIPVYISLTGGLETKEARRVAVKATITALVILMLFAVGGKFIFDFFSISVNSLRIVGGIIFFIAGYDMLQARFIRTKSQSESNDEFANDISLTPLAIPIICGPGAITVSIVLFNDASAMPQKLVLLLAIVLVLAITLLFLLSARKIMRYLGENGNKVLMRIMGLIVMVIAVEFIINGLRPILREIFKIS
ncbi:hypothetical protein BMS3Abin04_01588 [bacterium BMS3Abin04]|nr:hypothetical protein BMS3Abin04_01588 [bacterium BMS3Abin04]